MWNSLMLCSSIHLLIHCNGTHFILYNLLEVGYFPNSESILTKYQLLKSSRNTSERMRNSKCEAPNGSLVVKALKYLQLHHLFTVFFPHSLL